MKVTIPKGQHASGQLPYPWLFRLPSLKRWVRFNESARYLLPAYYQQDVNKLYGLGFGFSEAESVRYGWRWSEEKQGIELLAYCHIGGKLNRTPSFDFPVLATVKIGEVVELDIKPTSSAYLFLIRQNGQVVQHTEPHGKLASYGVTRGLYFGGVSLAPHDITIKLSSSPL